jgi:dihydrofolate reductase
MQGNGHATPDELAAGFARDGWALGAFADKTGQFITKVYQRAEAFLFCRRTYEIFQQTWGTNPQMRTHPIGVALNEAPEYVMSNSISDPNGSPSTLLSGDVTAAIQALKATPGGELQVHGSGALIRWLLANGHEELLGPMDCGHGVRPLTLPARATVYGFGR